MKLRNFIPTSQTLPPVNLYVLGYWEGEPGLFIVVRCDEHGIWLSSDPDMTDDYIAPTSWSYLPGGHDFNQAVFPVEVPDLDTEV